MDSNLAAALIVARERALRHLRRPARAEAKLMVGAASDLTCTRAELMKENASLRQHLIVLRRSIEQPRLDHDEHVLLRARTRLTRRCVASCTWSAPRRCCSGIVWGAERIRDDHRWAA